MGSARVDAVTGGKTLYVNPAGSDVNPCTQAAPCFTFNRAYLAASPGDEVLVETGRYPKQTIKADASKNSAADVVFQPAPGAQVQLVKLAIGASHLEIRDIATAGWNISPGADDVTVRNVKSDGAVYVTGASNVLVKGGEVFSSVPVSSDSMIASYGTSVPTNVTFDGVWFHDFMDVGPGNYHHIECLQVGAGQNLTITNSKFGPGCDTHGLFIRSWGNQTNGGPSPLDLHITNNVFLRCDSGCYSLMVYDDRYTLSQTDLEVGGNTFAPGSNWSFNWSHGPAAFYGNLLPTTTAFNCHYKASALALSANSFFHDNLFYGAGVGCGAHAKVTPNSTGLWVGNGDYHLAAGSPAIDTFPVGPAFDIDGDSRPQGGAIDAGADERPLEDTTPPIPTKLALLNSLARPATATQTLALSAVQAGDTVIAVVFGNARRPLSVSDSLGNAYTVDAESGSANALSSTSIYRYRYSTAQTSLTLSVTWTSAIAHQQVAVYAIPNVVAAPLGGRVASGAKSTTPSISAPATTRSNEVAIAAFRVMELNWAGSGWPAAGWNVLTDVFPPSGKGHLLVAYRLVPTPGPVSLGFRLGATTRDWSGALTTYAGG